MNKNNEIAALSAISDRTATNEQDNATRTSANSEEVKRTFGVAAMWAIRKAGRVFRIHNRLSRI